MSRARRMAMLTAVVLLLGGASQTGCGGAGAVRNLGLQFPEAEFMVATATSPVAADQAEARARAALAAQIRSRIRTVMVDEFREESRDGDSTTSSTTQRDIVQEAAFDRMELIRLDEASRRHANGLHHATVYLSRAEARTVLGADYSAAAARLAREAPPLAGIADDDLPGFAARYAMVRQAYAEVEARAMEIRAIGGSLPAGFFATRDLWFAAEVERSRRMEHLRLAVTVSPPVPAGDPIDRGALRQDLVEALGAAGLSIRGASCTEAPYLLVVQPRLTHQGMLGVVTRLNLMGYLQDCGTGDRWEIDLTDDAWTSEAPRADDAVRKVQKRVDARTLRRHLVEALSDHLPLR